MTPLTGRQRMCLDVIKESIATRGYPPTLREIGDAMGIHSTNGVYDHLLRLERKGYIARVDLKSRAIVVLDGARGKFIAPRKCLACRSTTFLDRCWRCASWARGAQEEP